MSLRLSWDDVNARARGLGTHLFTRAQLVSLARATDSAALTQAWRRLGLPLPTERATATPAELELAVRRWAATALRILARWAGGARVAALAVIYEEEDRKSLRAIVRGALRGVGAEARLAGLIPTPVLPERALAELARQPTPAAIATLLVAWRNPYGPPLVTATATQPDPFALDVALYRTFAARASAAARPAGPDLVRYVRETVDLDNAITALVLAVAGKDVRPKETFLQGGERVSITAFEEAAALGEPGAAGMRLAKALAPAAVAEAFRHVGQDLAGLEDALLRIRIRELARHTRRSPLGPAPALWFALRLRAQVVDLQRIVWGVALAVPRAAVAQALVTAA